MITAALVSYVLCLLVSAACTALLLRSWLRGRSRLVMWSAVAFCFLTVSNALLVSDLLMAADLSLIRALLIAIGLGLLVYGVALEEAQ
ncbi:MAG TPA: DUF5985 family protein [Thermoanaerobaculia bacterium]